MFNFSGTFPEVLSASVLSPSVFPEHLAHLGSTSQSQAYFGGSTGLSWTVLHSEAYPLAFLKLVFHSAPKTKKNSATAEALVLKTSLGFLKAASLMEITYHLVKQMTLLHDFFF